MNMIAVIVVALTIASGQHAAVEKTRNEETIIRNAKFVLSAFGCVATGVGSREDNERLFTAGMQAGREVLQFMRTATDTQRKFITSKSAIIGGLLRVPLTISGWGVSMEPSKMTKWSAK
jgi:hypothetical protein